MHILSEPTAHRKQEHLGPARNRFFALLSGSVDESVLERADELARSWQPNDARVVAGLRITAARLSGPDALHASKREALVAAISDLDSMEAVSPIAAALYVARPLAFSEGCAPAIALAEANLRRASLRREKDDPMEALFATGDQTGGSSGGHAERRAQARRLGAAG